MEEVTRKNEGDYTLNGDAQIHGTLAGNLTVQDGVHLVLHGMVTGDLIVRAGGSVVVHGIVDETVLIEPRSSVTVYGTINRLLSRNASIGPEAVIKDPWCISIEHCSNAGSWP